VPYGRKETSWWVGRAVGRDRDTETHVGGGERQHGGIQIEAGGRREPRFIDGKEAGSDLFYNDEKATSSNNNNEFFIGQK